MKVKVCYACVHVTGTFRHQNRPKHAVGRGTPSLHTSPYFSILHPFQRLRRLDPRPFGARPSWLPKRNVSIRHCLEAKATKFGLKAKDSYHCRLSLKFTLSCLLRTQRVEKHVKHSLYSCTHVAIWIGEGAANEYYQRLKVKHAPSY